MTQGVMVKRPNVAIRKGLRLIADTVNDDFDNAFERLFPSITEKEIAHVMEALEWLEQYAWEDTDTL